MVEISNTPSAYEAIVKELIVDDRVLSIELLMVLQLFTLDVRKKHPHIARDVVAIYKKMVTL